MVYFGSSRPLVEFFLIVESYYTSPIYLLLIFPGKRVAEKLTYVAANYSTFSPFSFSSLRSRTQDPALNVICKFRNSYLSQLPGECRVAIVICKEKLSVMAAV